MSLIQVNKHISCISQNIATRKWIHKGNKILLWHMMLTYAVLSSIVLQIYFTIFLLKQIAEYFHTTPRNAL